MRSRTRFANEAPMFRSLSLRSRSEYCGTVEKLRNIGASSQTSLFLRLGSRKSADRQTNKRRLAADASAYTYTSRLLCSCCGSGGGVAVVRRRTSKGMGKAPPPPKETGERLSLWDEKREKEDLNRGEEI
uniref:Uncharacterized protein n=1 Tax=Caenorhabditis japonica TaxID=281687 RepID=A0A8R1EIK7_CAEJA